MAIIFWSEFPEQVDWDKVNREINFDTEIYVACKDRQEYLAWKKKIKNKHIDVGAWPILDKKDGYWFSGQTSKENIDKLDEFKDVDVKIDIEPKIYHGRYSNIKTWLWLIKWYVNPGKNKEHLLDKIKSLKSSVIISGFFLPRFFRRRVGMEANGKKNFICYSTVGRIAFPYYKFMIKKMSKDNFYAIGLTHPGVFGNEKAYKHKEEFVKDLETMKKLRVKNLVIYSLEGIIKRDWLDAVKDYVGSF